MRVRTLEEIESERETRIGEASRGTKYLMMPDRRGGHRCMVTRTDPTRGYPGSSTHLGVDFVKAVYADHTGQ